MVTDSDSGADGAAAGFRARTKLFEDDPADFAEGMMTGKLGSAVTAAVVQMITAPSGMNSGLAALTAPDSLLAQPVAANNILAQNVAADLAEKSLPLQYPSVNIYCDKISNDLTEKFRSFSGTVQMAVEVRHSQDRLDGLQNALEVYVDSVTQVLDAQRGDWGNGMFFTGEYDVTLGAVKHGGKNFLQTAKVTFAVGVSRS